MNQGTIPEEKSALDLDEAELLTLHKEARLIEEGIALTINHLRLCAYKVVTGEKAYYDLTSHQLRSVARDIHFTFLRKSAMDNRRVKT